MRAQATRFADPRLTGVRALSFCCMPQVRMQTSPLGTFTGPMHCARYILQHEGVGGAPCLPPPHHACRPLMIRHDTRPSPMSPMSSSAASRPAVTRRPRGAVCCHNLSCVWAWLQPFLPQSLFPARPAFKCVCAGDHAQSPAQRCSPHPTHPNPQPNPCAPL